MTDHICPSSPCPRCRDQDERTQAESDRSLGAALRSPQCMECKGHGSIILGRSDSQVRSRAIVQCAECRFFFHTDCIIRHFETAAAKRIVALESENAGLKTAMEGHIVRLANELDESRASSESWRLRFLGMAQAMRDYLVTAPQTGNVPATIAALEKEIAGAQNKETSP